jgi:ribosomal-protein-alanine N-acetyltransferase
VGVNIRWMIRRDLPEVLAIENVSFEFPWNEDDFTACLRERNTMGMVAEHGDQVVGYMLYRTHDYKLHLLSIASHWQHRSCGIGLHLIEKLKSKLAFRRRNRITVDVRETNLSAQLFFKACGFEAVSVVKTPWPETSDDAYRLVYRVPVLSEPEMEISK